MKIGEIKKIAYLRTGSKTIFLPKGTNIRWMESSSVILNSNEKTHGFMKCFKHFNKMQIPVFEFKVNKDQTLIIRGKNRDYIYRPTERKVNFNEDIFLHPQSIKQIFNN